MNATETKSFAELHDLYCELFPESAKVKSDWEDGVIAVMGESPAKAWVYRCGRDSTGKALTPCGYYTYFVARDDDECPMEMSDWSSVSRVRCTWDRMADAMRQVAAKTWRG